MTTAIQCCVTMVCLLITVSGHCIFCHAAAKLSPKVKSSASRRVFVTFASSLINAWVLCMLQVCHYMFEKFRQRNAVTFCHCALGASFFYQPGGVSYQAQEVRAYGLLLKDLASRVRRDVCVEEPDQQSYEALHHIVLLCTDSSITATLRPSFSQLHAKLNI